MYIIKVYYKYTKQFKDFPGGSDSKESAYNAGDLGSVPGLGRYPGEGNGYPTPAFLPGKPHGWRSLIGYNHGVAKSWTRLSNFTSLQSNSGLPW